MLENMTGVWLVITGACLGFGIEIGKQLMSFLFSHVESWIENSEKEDEL